MQLTEGKQKFISSWGDLATQWGITKTMGQIHALLMLSSKAMNADMIMDELQISGGNANMNIRALLEWELLQKKTVIGDRKDYFVAEKDFWIIFKKIVEHRKKKELDPLISLLEEISEVGPNCNESKEFCKVVKELKLFSSKADSALENVMNSKANWLIGSYFKMMR